VTGHERDEQLGRVRSRGLLDDHPVERLDVVVVRQRVTARARREDQVGAAVQGSLEVGMPLIEELTPGADDRNRLSSLVGIRLRQCLDVSPRACACPARQALDRRQRLAVADLRMGRQMAAALHPEYHVPVFVRKELEDILH
jgi:hypothetical protein